MSIEHPVISILARVLQLGDRASQLDRNSPLLGAIPEFDSMAVVTVLTALEENYGFTIEDDEIDASLFATVGTLMDFVERKANS
jgi:acyl carrier protein